MLSLRRERGVDRRFWFWVWFLLFLSYLEEREKTSNGCSESLSFGRDSGDEMFWGSKI